MRRLAALSILAALASCGLAAAEGPPAPARKFDPGRDSPFIAMLDKADADRDGTVSRADVEAPLEAVQKEQEAKIRETWAATALFLRVSPPDRAVPLREVVDATLAALKEADTDGDGNVSGAEIEAYAAREADPARREAVSARLRAADVNGDGTVDAAEHRIEITPEQAAQDVGVKRIEYMIAGTRLWQRKSIDTLFERHAGPDGRIVIRELSDRLREAAAEKSRKD